MSKMSKALSSDISGNPVFIMLMFVLVIIIFLAIFRSVSPFLTMGLGFNAHVGSLRGSFQIEAFENQESNGPVFAMYGAGWCGHCKSTRPHFDDFKQSYKGPVKIMYIDCEDDNNKELVAQQKVSGFPTFRYYPSGLSGKYDEYNGERNAEGFKEYVSSQITGVTDPSPDNAASVNYNK
jgi:thiol-disulfide isomerase/thioredoxin